MIEEIRQQLGAPKIVIHNAVGAERGTYLDVDAEKMRAAFEINTMALLSLAKQLVPDMQAVAVVHLLPRVIRHVPR